MASVYKHRNSWRAEIRRKGHKPIGKSFKTKGKAETWARMIEQHIDDEQDNRCKVAIKFRLPEIQEVQQRPGVVYVMFMPGAETQFKVGRTKNTAEERAREISHGTGVAQKLIPIVSIPTVDAVAAESVVHKALAKHRVNLRREFFTAPLGLITETIFNACRAVDKIAADA